MKKEIQCTDLTTLRMNVDALIYGKIDFDDIPNYKFNHEFLCTLIKRCTELGMEDEAFPYVFMVDYIAEWN